MTKKVLKGPIKTRKARNKTTARPAAVLRPVRTATHHHPRTTGRRRSGRSDAPSPGLPHQEVMSVPTPADEAAAEAEQSALKALWGAVDPFFKRGMTYDNATVTVVAKAATKCLEHLKEEIKDVEEDLEGAEVALGEAVRKREEAEQKLQEEIETGEEGTYQRAMAED